MSGARHGQGITLLAALAGMLVLAPVPAPASDGLVLTANGELRDTAASLPAGHPASVHPAVHPAGVHPAVVPVSATPASAATPPEATPEVLPEAMPGTGEAAAEEAPEGSRFLYRARTLRDPFSLPAEVRAPASSADDVPPLQRHALSDFRLVGVVLAGSRPFAMVTTADGKGYTIRVGTRIGPDDGRVRRITKNAVIVEVVQPDEFGELKKSETILALRPEEVVP